MQSLLQFLVIITLAMIYIVSCREFLPKGFYCNEPHQAVIVGVYFILIALSYIIRLLSIK